MSDTNASFILISLKCSIVPFTTARNPSALKLRPSNDFICVEQILRAAALVNPEVTYFLNRNFNLNKLKIPTLHIYYIGIRNSKFQKLLSS